MYDNAVLAVDIGATNLKSSLLSGKPKKFQVFQRNIEDTKPILEDLQKQLVKLIEHYIEYCQNRYRLLGIGIATAGRVDFSRGKIVYATDNIKNFSGFSLKKYLNNEFSLPVIIENDANAAGWGEYVSREMKSCNNMCFLTLGTGVGGAIILQDSIIRGSNYRAGEMGHMQIVKNGRKCTCGYNGCWESYVGKRGILKTASKYYPEEKNEKITVKEIFDAYPDCIEARKTLEETGRYLAIGLKNIIHVFDPGWIVLGGGISLSGDKLINIINKNLFDDKIRKKDVNLEIAQMGNMAGQYGIKEIFLCEKYH